MVVEMMKVVQMTKCIGNEVMTNMALKNSFIPTKEEKHRKDDKLVGADGDVHGKQAPAAVRHHKPLDLHRGST